MFKITRKKPGTAGSAHGTYPWRCPYEHTVNEDSDTEMPVDDPNPRVEWQYRLQRNEMIKRYLQDGIAVQYRQTGDSLYPFVHSGDSCLFEPVFDCGTLKKLDIVFCQVEPDDHYYAHEIIDIELQCIRDPSAGSARHPSWKRVRKFIIGNNKGHCNGTASDHTVYGRLVEVVR